MKISNSKKPLLTFDLSLSYFFIFFRSLSSFGFGSVLLGTSYKLVKRRNYRTNVEQEPMLRLWKKEKKEKKSLSRNSKKKISKIIFHEMPSWFLLIKKAGIFLDFSSSLPVTFFPDYSSPITFYSTFHPRPSESSHRPLVTKQNCQFWVNFFPFISYLCHLRKFKLFVCNFYKAAATFKFSFEIFCVHWKVVHLAKDSC